jgi:toxin YoeB
MEVAYTLKAQKDLEHWEKLNDAKIKTKISNLIQSIQENHFTGIGKPEPLKYNLKGCWSRRINKEHRIIYEVLHNKILVHSLKGHY